MLSDSAHQQQCSWKSCFSFKLETAVSLEPLWALRLGEDGWRSDPAAVGGGGSRKQAPSEVIHPNCKTVEGSRGAGCDPNRVRGGDALPFPAQISPLPPLLRAGLFQSQTGCRVPSQSLMIFSFFNQIPHHCL